MPSIRDIISAVEEFAPRSLQEEYDNSGIQTAPDVDRDCTGVMLSVDVTPEVVDEALASGCNLLLAHHPLLFRGVKSLTGATPVEAALIKAVKGDLTIYCCHTSLDNAPAGVSARMASMLGLKDVRTLDEVGPDTGSGAIGMLEAPLWWPDAATLRLTAPSAVWPSAVARVRSSSPRPSGQEPMSSLPPT